MTAEALGAALLLAAVVGSGIMGKRLSGGNVAITARRRKPGRRALERRAGLCGGSRDGNHRDAIRRDSGQFSRAINH
jgi:hypothetical protein